jgi:PAS domain S-box-containing protein
VAKQLLKNKPRAEQILEHITQCVITTDLDGIVTYWNAASEQIFGYSSEEMLNKSLIKIYPSIAKEQFQEDLEKLRRGEKVQGQWKSLTKEGNIVWVDVFAKPLRNADGQPEAIIASAYNIQEFKRIEVELAENKAQAQAILETTVDGILTIDEDWNILSFNKAASEIFGYSEKEVLGKSASKLISEPYRSQYENYYKRYLETGERNIIGYRHEIAGQRKDGSVFSMELSVSEVKWQNQRIFTAVVNDISERRRLEKEILRISEEERRNLGQDLHDGLGQMLTGISLISQNLARKLDSNGIPGADKVQEISDLIKEADEYAKGLAHGLIHVDFQDEGLEAALKQLSNQAEKFFNIRCSFNYDTDKNIANNIRAMNLYRIAQEAISNAVKHGGAKNIHIQLTSNNGSVKLSIQDDGIGFTESDLDKKKKGMGVNIMKYRANMMAGSLEITENGDSGTKVVCTIPHYNI